MILFWCKFLDFYPSAERTTSLSNWRVLRNVVLFQFHIVRCCKKTCEQAVTWKNWKIHESFWWIFVCYSLFMCFGISNFSQSTWLNLKKGPFINYVTQIRTMFYPLPPLSHNYALESRTDITPYLFLCDVIYECPLVFFAQ